MFCKRKGFYFFSSKCNINSRQSSVLIARVHDPFRVRVLLLSHFTARFFAAFIRRKICRLHLPPSFAAFIRRNICAAYKDVRQP